MKLHDWRHLQAAEGWLGLDDLDSATRELAEISPEARENPAVLSAQYHIYAQGEQWDKATALAVRLTGIMPEEAATWIWLAYATRRTREGGIRQAKDILVQAQPKFPRKYIFPFNLACYCSQLGEFAEAEKWLKKASRLDEKTARKLAIDDPDLKPLWVHLGGTIWNDE